MTLECFDAFHAEQVEALYDFLRRHQADIVVQARAEGGFHERAYNPYAKVVNLAFSHWCFLWGQPKTGKVKCPPSEYPQLRHCLHVPLDEKVFDGVRDMIAQGLLPRPRIPIPCGGMGSIRTQKDYLIIQNYLRCEVDKIASTNFPCSKVSPLAFDGLWSENDEENRVDRPADAGPPPPAPDKKTPWGSRVNKGAGSLDIVILDIPKGREFTEAEIAAEVRRRGLTERGDVRGHLVNRQKKGFVAKTQNGWKRISD